MLDVEVDAPDGWVVFSKDEFNELVRKGRVTDVVNIDVGVRGGYMDVRGERIQVLDATTAKLLIPAILVTHPLVTCHFGQLLERAPLV